MIRTVAFLCPQPPVPCLCLVSRVFPPPYFSVLCLVSRVSRLVSCALHLCLVSCVLCLVPFGLSLCLMSCVLCLVLSFRKETMVKKLQYKGVYHDKTSASRNDTFRVALQTGKKRHTTRQQNKRPKHTTHGCVEINLKSV